MPEKYSREWELAQEQAMADLPGVREQLGTVVFTKSDGQGWASVHGGLIEDVKRWLWEDEVDGKIRENYTVASTPVDLPRRVKFELERLWDEKLRGDEAAHPDM
jgi:hypothetical protein